MVMELKKDPPSLPDPPKVVPPEVTGTAQPPRMFAPRTYSIFAQRPTEGVVGGVLINHRSNRISCSVLVSRIMDMKQAVIKFEIRPTDGGVYMHELIVKAGEHAVADVSLKVPACAVKVLADDACQDVYVTITAYPEGSNA